VTLAFFLLSAWCLHGLVREIWARGIAAWTLLAYLGMPLALFYSRAVHIDFPALAFAHAMAWCWARAVLRGSRRWLLFGVVLAIPAVLIKAPYAATLLLPLVAVGLRSPHWRRLVPVLPVVVIPALVFVLWQRHSLAINAAAPDWSFIPTYRRFVDNSHWYYGEWRQRLDLERWSAVASRLVFEGVGLLGLIPACAGGCLVFAQRRLWPVAAWLAGLGLYVVVFFNLNVVHNYYQIPWLAPLALCLVVGLGWVAGVLTRSAVAASRLMMVLLLACAALWVAHAERYYYAVPVEYLEVAALVNDHTPEDALVVVAFRGLDPRAPHILYPAHRDGWSIPERDLTPDLLERLQQEGATHLAMAWTKAPPDPALVAYVRELGVLAVAQVEGSWVGVYRLDD
jgi:4-amino-4-deoxy-L-arabinose transferase-like glycosyltransferase